MTARILITGHGRVAALAVIALLDATVTEIGTGTVVMRVNEPDLQAFNWPEPAHFAPPRNSRRQTAQWKAERKGRRP